MIKKKVLLLCMLLGCSPLFSYAQGVDITDTVWHGRVIEFGAAADSGAEIRVTVSRTDGGDTADDIYWISEQTADSGGNAKFVFILPDERSGKDTSGEYRILAKADGRDISEKTFYFVSAPVRASVIKTVNSVQNAEELAEMFENGAESRRAFVCMGIPVAFYDALGAAESVKSAETLLGMKNGDFTEETFRTAFINSYGIAALNAAEDEKTEEILLSVAPKYGDTEFSETDESLKKWICEIVNKNKPYDDADALDKVYTEANILRIFNTARYNALEQLFADNAVRLSISGKDFYRSYCLMDKDSKAAVGESVVKTLAASPATEYSAVSAALKTAVEKQTAAVPSGGGNSGGSGGSSGGGGGNSSNLGSIGASNTSNTIFPTEKYTDTAGSEWAFKAIETLTDAGVVSGVGDGKFEPDRKVSREEFVKMVVLAANIKNGGAEIRFDDVNKNSWAAEYISRAVAAGVVTGESETVFGVGKAVTRQDMAVIVCRAAGDALLETESKIGFADRSDISDYALESVGKLCGANVIRGFEDNTFRPFEPSTRAMAAQVIYNMFFK